MYPNCLHRHHHDCVYTHTCTVKTCFWWREEEYHETDDYDNGFDDLQGKEDEEAKLREEAWRKNENITLLLESIFLSGILKQYSWAAVKQGVNEVSWWDLLSNNSNARIRRRIKETSLEGVNYYASFLHEGVFSSHFPCMLTLFLFKEEKRVFKTKEIKK